MTSMTIRELDPERDAAGVVVVMREVLPTIVINVAAWQHRERTVPERSRQRGFVAEIGGEIVGRAISRFENLFTDATDLAFIGVGVRPAWRRQGIGSALYEAALEHAVAIDAARLLASVVESDDGPRFAQSRGFVEERSQQESVLDPRTVREAPAADVDLRRVADVDPHLVHAVDEAATRDQPSTEQIDAIPYDEWVAHVLDHPLFTADGSFVAMVDGIAAAVSLLFHDPETGRSANMFTGTMPGYRGRGLALAVKLGSIHWAAERGVTSMVTTNDDVNAPMLAINRRLGYRPSGRYFDYTRNLVRSSEPGS
jgi:GNAT superfamily N-acetyltransferase